MGDLLGIPGAVGFCSHFFFPSAPAGSRCPQEASAFVSGGIVPFCCVAVTTEFACGLPFACFLTSLLVALLPFRSFLFFSLLSPYSCLPRPSTAAAGTSQTARVGLQGAVPCSGMPTAGSHPTFPVGSHTRCQSPLSLYSQPLCFTLFLIFLPRAPRPALELPGAPSGPCECAADALRVSYLTQEGVELFPAGHGVAAG